MSPKVCFYFDEAIILKSYPHKGGSLSSELFLRTCNEITIKVEVNKFFFFFELGWDLAFCLLG